MPELTVYRKNIAPPPMVCRYCGATATSTQECREENHKPVRGGGGTDLTSKQLPRNARLCYCHESNLGGGQIVGLKLRARSTREHRSAR